MGEKNINASSGHEKIVDYATREKEEGRLLSNKEKMILSARKEKHAHGLIYFRFLGA